jgi:hypothetical protein
MVSLAAVAKLLFGSATDSYDSHGGSCNTLIFRLNRIFWETVELINRESWGYAHGGTDLQAGKLAW